MATEDGRAPTAQPAEEPRPGFFERDPAKLAAEANLGPDGANVIANLQRTYREIFEVIDDRAWPNQPEGPLATHWLGLGGSRDMRLLCRHDHAGTQPKMPQAVFHTARANRGVTGVSTC
jgi:hypothetical protein